MIQLNSANPPTMPSNEALSTALAILAVAADSQATKRRLGELIDQLGIVRAAHDELAAKRKSIEDEQAKLADLHEREKAVNEREQAVVQAQTQAAVASAALAAREAALDKRAGELEKRAGDIAARQAALAAKLASYRQALA